MKRRILIIDDELSTCTMLKLALRDSYEVKYAIDAMQGLSMFKAERFDLVLLDLIIGEHDGIEILKQIKDYDRDVTVIMITAFGNIKSSVEAIKNGAFNYLSKPIDMDELFVFIEQALRVRNLSDEVVYLSDELKNHRFQSQGLIGNSAPIRKVYTMIEKLKDVDTTVTITGESGTGKELVARAIHFTGKRKDKRFVVINCAAIPENLLEGELFGYKRGTFTGAIQDKKGKFEVADKGTIFLDEIGDMQLNLQSKLLRVLQQKEYTPLGSNEVHKTDVRIIAATNKNLETMVKEGSFREDLFYRLSVMNIHMPPLRERKEDIPLLCQHFIEKFGREQNKRVKKITPETMEVLMSYDYPGNIRQLANFIEHAMIISNGYTIDIKDLPGTVKGTLHYEEQKEIYETNFRKRLSKMSIKEIERIAIEATLEKNAGKREPTAKDLGISIRSLHNKIKEYGLV
ncbi:MAG: sigma-54-dependent Fis family transcriptional regulator [Clostridiales bacterium]|nr:sigma-54-dependent Fis family transcriptional regulator [Clostridiales bacterium]